MPFVGTRYATLPQSTKFTAGDFTISLWFNPATAADRMLFMRGFAYRDQPGDIGLKVNLANGDLDFEARTADSRWIFGWDAPQSLLHSPFKLKEWNHVVVTRRGESYAMWMNGVKVRTALVGRYFGPRRHEPVHRRRNDDRERRGGPVSRRSGRLPHLPSLLVRRGNRRLA